MRKEKQAKRFNRPNTIGRMKNIIRAACAPFVFFVLASIAKAQGSGVSLPTGTGLSEKPLPDILKGLVGWLLLIFGYVAIISFVVTGIMYLMGGSMTGEKKDVSGAKKQLQWSITGVIVGLSGYIILKAVDAWLQGSSTF